MQFRPERRGILGGMSEVRALLTKVLPENARAVWAMEDGAGRLSQTAVTARRIVAASRLDERIWKPAGRWR